MDINNNNSKGVPYISGFFLLIGFAILGLVASGMVGALILLSSTGGNAAAMKDAINNPQNANLVRLIQAIGVVISMVLPAYLAALILNRKPLRLLGFRKEARPVQIGLVIAIMFCALFVAGALGYLNKDIAQWFGLSGWAEKLEKAYNEQVVVMLDMKGIGGYVLSLFIMAFLPALSEEMLFRGGLQNFLTRATKMPLLSILIVSLLFSLVHFSVYGFLVRFFLGLVLGYIYYYTGNLWMSIVAHFFNNALAVTGIFVLTRQGRNITEAINKEVSPSYWGFLALPVIIWLFAVLMNASKKEQPETAQL